MKFDQLWAPWRIQYVTAGDAASTRPQSERAGAWEPGAERSCFLCRAVAGTSPQDDRENLVVCRTGHAVAVLNRYPYNNGHLLVAPRRHIGELAALTDDEHADLMKLIVRLCEVLKRLMKPEGFNIGMNLGRMAGAGVPDHVHWHIVPRWQGDTNFMPVVAGVNVIPQALDALVDLLHEALEDGDQQAAPP